MNQGKFEMIEQEMARVNINVLGISELKWTGMGEFNSDDHYISSLSHILFTRCKSPGPADMRQARI